MHPYTRMHICTLTDIHKENSFEIFLAAGWAFQTETSVASSASHPAPYCFLLHGGKLSKKHFSLGTWCFALVKGFVKIVFYFLYSCMIFQQGVSCVLNLSTFMAPENE